MLRRENNEIKIQSAKNRVETVIGKLSCALINLVKARLTNVIVLRWWEEVVGLLLVEALVRAGIGNY